MRGWREHEHRAGAIVAVEDASAGSERLEQRRPGAAGITETALQVARRYPEPLRAAQLADVPRIVFHVEQVYRPGAAIADLGGGVGLFSPTCAALGMRTWLVDDFRDEVNRDFSIDAIGVHRPAGVQIVACPVTEWGRSFEAESLDVVTCFDSMEHWHHSPRPALLHAMKALRPGGLLFLSGPNAVNLRKRLTVPFGRSNWSHFDDWFYPDEFRGHVREPTLAELRRIVRELGFEERQVWGRNWAGPEAGWRGAVRSLVDRSIRTVPTLCSDLYVLAAKPT
jgi:2-polyprenyl-3-methyl-5-hydroxy-6-metoxy-1,4-benzoquinol methylase